MQQMRVYLQECISVARNINNMVNGTKQPWPVTPYHEEHARSAAFSSQQAHVQAATHLRPAPTSGSTAVCVMPLIQTKRVGLPIVAFCAQHATAAPCLWPVCHSRIVNLCRPTISNPPPPWPVSSHLKMKISPLKATTSPNYATQHRKAQQHTRCIKPTEQRGAQAFGTFYKMPASIWKFSESANHLQQQVVAAGMPSNTAQLLRGIWPLSELLRLLGRCRYVTILAQVLDSVCSAVSTVGRSRCVVCWHTGSFAAKCCTEAIIFPLEARSSGNTPEFCCSTGTRGWQHRHAS